MALLLVRQPPQRLRRSVQQACLAGSRVCSTSFVHMQTDGPAAYRQNCFDSEHSCWSGQSFRRSRQRSPRRSGLVFAGWGADIAWSKARVVETSPAAQGLRRIILDIGKGAESHQRPGQFLQLRVEESNPGFYAIASPPDPNNQGIIELLIKEEGQTAELLASQVAGAEVDASAVQGKGFQIEKAPASQFPTVLIFATGSGISPIKSLIESGTLEANQRQDVRLYYGTFNPEQTAYKDLVPQWQAEGVHVTHVFSDDGQGYVQDAFERDGLADGGKACAVLVGQKDMCISVTDLLVARGVDKDKILLNF